MSLAKLRGLLTSGFDLVGDDRLLATMEGSFWREGGRVRVGNDTWELRRQGWSTFRLVRNNLDEAVARARGFFKSTFEIDHAGRTYQLTRQSVWRRPTRRGDTSSCRNLRSRRPTSVGRVLGEPRRLAAG